MFKNRLGFLLAVVVALGVTAAGCKKTCTPGQSSACAGTGGCTGFQVCSDDGEHYGECLCGASDGGTDAGTDAAQPDLAVATFPCSPKSSCVAADKSCIGLVDNAGKTQFGLRLSSLQITKPDALTKGIIRSTLGSAVTPTVPSCNLQGSATFNWLLQFDTAAGTIKTGFAKPVSDPTNGYSFVDEMITQGTVTFHVQPVTYMAKPDTVGKFSISMGTDLLAPIYLDLAATQVILLPLHEGRFSMGTLSSNNNCIGQYNAAGLKADNSCLADDLNPEFLTAGTFDGFITLEEADTVEVGALSESLCVLLSGDAATYGDGTRPITRCKRTGGIINFRGDTCSTAGQTCKDAVALGANLAASSILINN